jgi:hypothetical protein
MWYEIVSVFLDVNRFCGQNRLLNGLA